jgi:hypothetical protein
MLSFWTLIVVQYSHEENGYVYLHQHGVEYFQLYFDLSGVVIVAPAELFTFLRLISLFSNQRLRSPSSFEYRSFLKNSIDGCFNPKFQIISLSGKRSSLRSLVQNKMAIRINHYVIQRQSNQGGSTNSLLSYFYFHTTLFLIHGSLMGTHSGRVQTVSKTHLVSNAFYRVNMVLR